MNIDIHIIINMNDNFGVGDHFQVFKVSEGTCLWSFSTTPEDGERNPEPKS